jgi:hypothetical protein
MLLTITPPRQPTTTATGTVIMVALTRRRRQSTRPDGPRSILTSCQKIHRHRTSQAIDAPSHSQHR